MEELYMESGNRPCAFKIDGYDRMKGGRHFTDFRSLVFNIITYTLEKVPKIMMNGTEALTLSNGEIVCGFCKHPF